MSKFNSSKYWENRYNSGGNSGCGSYNSNCDYKASVINRFLEQNKITSSIELGCGDGNQLSHINYKRYYGFDVSETAVKICKDKFEHEKEFNFTSNLEDLPLKSELVLSLDVIYHLVEDGVYEKYIKDLFSKSSKYVIIFSTNYENNKTSSHVKHREILPYIKKQISDFDLFETLQTPNEIRTSANFYFFKKKE